MLNIKKSLPFLLLLALLTGCRYEDGPLVSFRSPWTRLTMHPKKLTRLEMDGVDYLPMFNADFPNSTFQFTKEGHWSYYIIYWSSDRFTEPVWAGMTTKFEDTNGNAIQFNFLGPDRSKPDVLDYVSIETSLKYKYLLITDTVAVNGYYILPLYEINRLTVNKVELESIKQRHHPDSPERIIYFETQ